MTSYESAAITTLYHHHETDLWIAPVGGGYGIACGVGFPARVIAIPRRVSATRRQMPCDLNGVWLRGDER